MKEKTMEEYQAQKQKDMEKAVIFSNEIQASKDPMVRYKDSRPIMDLKHMIETSAQIYKDKPEL